MRKSALILGIHPVQTLLEQQPNRVHSICILEGSAQTNRRVQYIVELAKKAAIALRNESMCFFTETFKESVNHQGVMALYEPLEPLTEKGLLTLLDNPLLSPNEGKSNATSASSPLLLILDGVQDPHNLGACLRTANASGVTAVIVPKHHAVGMTPVVRKVASGAAEFTQLAIVTNLARTLNMLKEKGFWLFGAAVDPGAKSVYEMDFRGPCGIVLGAEGTGMRRLTETHCDLLFTIPMSGMVKSLNVSVAAGVCLFEAVRQRQGFSAR